MKKLYCIPGGGGGGGEGYSGFLVTGMIEGFRSQYLSCITQYLTCRYCDGLLYNHGYKTLTFCKLCEKNITSINNISKRPRTFNENGNYCRENIEFTESTDRYPMSSYVICSVEINSSENENVHNSRLSFLFSILFPLAKSRFCV